MLFQALLSGSIKAITGGSIRAIIDTPPPPPTKSASEVRFESSPLPPKDSTQFHRIQFPGAPFEGHPHPGTACGLHLYHPF